MFYTILKKLRFFFLKYIFSQITFFRKVRETNIHFKSFLKFDSDMTFWYMNQPMLEKKSKNGRFVYMFRLGA